MTCKKTIETAGDVMGRIGVRARSYSYREKNPAKHLDAFYLRVGRLLDIQTLGRAVSPFSVTKKRQWQAVLEYVDLRLASVGVDEKGRVQRGGNCKGRAYSKRELELARILRALNARGPGAKAKEAAWLKKLSSV